MISLYKSTFYLLTYFVVSAVCSCCAVCLWFVLNDLPCLCICVDWLIDLNGCCELTYHWGLWVCAGIGKNIPHNMFQYEHRQAPMSHHYVCVLTCFFHSSKTLTLQAAHLSRWSDDNSCILFPWVGMSRPKSSLEHHWSWWGQCWRGIVLTLAAVYMFIIIIIIIIL